LITTNHVHIKKPRWNRFKLFALHQNDFPNNFTVRTWLHEPIQHLLPENFTIGQSRLFVSEAEKSGINKLLTRDGLNGKYFVVTPGAAWAQKRWKAERYARVIDQCAKEFNMQAVLIGGVGDDICEMIQNSADSRVIDRHGKTNLRESLAIISQAEFVLGSDTGFLHAGEALGISAVTLLGPTAKETGAGVFLQSSQVVEKKGLWCRPCSQNGSIPCYRKEQYCMNGIETDHVFSAITRLDIS
jgi:heptosyltransferase-2